MEKTRPGEQILWPCSSDMVSGSIRLQLKGRNGARYVRSGMSVLVVVHLQVRRDAERFHVGGVFRKDRNADTGADTHGMFAELQWLVQKLHERLANEDCFVAAGGLL